jgi:hypothetical protein
MMANQTQTTQPNALTPSSRPVASSGLVPYRISVRQFEKMIDAGTFRDEGHVELLGGLLIDKMVKNELRRWVRRTVKPRVRRRAEDPG